MSDTVLENRTTTLEKMMIQLTRNVERTTRNLDSLGKELRASHEEMRTEHRQFREEQKDQQKQWNKQWEQLREDRKAEKKEWNKQWGKLSNKWGTMVEDLVAPSLPRLLRDIAPCPPDDKPIVQIRAERRHPSQKGSRFEMDGVVDCGEYALFCECKSTLKSADITKLISKLAQARDYFPEYTHHHLLGGVAALHIEPSLVQYALDKGIFAFAVGEELMDVQNEAGFTPQHF